MNIRRMAVVTGFAKGFTKVEDLCGFVKWIVAGNGGQYSEQQTVRNSLIQAEWYPVGFQKE
jgi:hypothetical protein